MAISPDSFRQRRGFTLMELLVVIGLLTLLLAMALPMVNVLTGNRSIEGARNELGAALGAARSEAMQVQRCGGVLIYHDAASNRMGLAAVVGDEQNNLITLELSRDRETVLLPPGVWCAAINNGTTSPLYIRPEPIGDSLLIGGVILFDPRGQLISLPYRFAVGPANGKSPLGDLLYPVTNPPAPYVPTTWLSQVGVVFYPQEQADSADDNFLNNYAMPLVVNRYNGTLIKGE